VKGSAGGATLGPNVVTANRAGDDRSVAACACSSPRNPRGVAFGGRDLGHTMVRRVVARRVLPERPPSWAQLLTHAQWEALRPAFRADRRLQAECRVLLLRLPASERAAFVAALATHLRRKRRPPHALGLAIEAAARRSFSARRTNDPRAPRAARRRR
jgi:hypothetical protein